MNNLITNIENLSENQVKLINYATGQEWGTPDFKMRHFVGDAQITPFAKMRQFIIELRNREEMVEDMELAVEKNELEIELQKEIMNKEESDIKKKIHNVEVKKLEKDLLRYKRRLLAAYEERKRVARMIEEMYKTGEAYLEDGRDIMEIFNTPEEEFFEAHYWTRRLGKQAALDIVGYGRISAGNMEAITMMSEDLQVETLRVALDFSGRLNSGVNIINDKVKEQLSESKLSLQLEAN